MKRLIRPNLLFIMVLSVFALFRYTTAYCQVNHLETIKFNNAYTGNYPALKSVDITVEIISEISDFKEDIILTSRITEVKINSFSFNGKTILIDQMKSEIVNEVIKHIQGNYSFDLYSGDKLLRSFETDVRSPRPFTVYYFQLAGIRATESGGLSHEEKVAHTASLLKSGLLKIKKLKAKSISTNFNLKEYFLNHAY